MRNEARKSFVIKKGSLATAPRAGLNGERVELWRVSLKTGLYRAAAAHSSLICSGSTILFSQPESMSGCRVLGFSTWEFA